MAIFEITMLFLGSIIGAGFATGAEIVTFFGNWQLPVWIIAIIVGTSIFFMIALEIFLFHSKNNNIVPPTTCKTLYIGIVMIYLILFTAMTAGITQITNQTTCIITLIFSALVTHTGIHKLARFNVLVVATIITLIISTALPHLSTTAISTIRWQHLTPTFFWAILYAGLNCFMFPELIKAYHKHKRKTLLIAGLFTAVSVTVLLGLILTTIQSTHSTTATIPLLAAAPTPTTLIIILLAILTSQYTALFAIKERLGTIIPITKNKPLLTTVCICLIALLASLCGFTRIIKYGYPLIGAFTCFYLLFSFWKRFWQASHQQRPQP